MGKQCMRRKCASHRSESRKDPTRWNPQLDTGREIHILQLITLYISRYSIFYSKGENPSEACLRKISELFFLFWTPLHLFNFVPSFVLNIGYGNI